MRFFEQVISSCCETMLLVTYAVRIFICDEGVAITESWVARDRFNLSLITFTSAGIFQ